MIPGFRDAAQATDRHAGAEAFRKACEREHVAVGAIAQALQTIQ